MVLRGDRPAAAAAVLAACGGDNGGDSTVNARPSFVVGAINSTSYNGTSDDLLTGGAGKTGLAGATPPAIADPVNPTSAEFAPTRDLQQLSRHRDVAPNGGYGTLYGPNVDINGNATDGEGKIAGTEYLAYADDGTGAQNVTLMAQIPSTFDRNNACMVTAASSGSRGVYARSEAPASGLSTAASSHMSTRAAAWACTICRPHGECHHGMRQSAAAAARPPTSRPTCPPPTWRRSRGIPDPHRRQARAFTQNPEKDWGRDTLRAIKSRFMSSTKNLATHSPERSISRQFTSSNTIVHRVVDIERRPVPRCKPPKPTPKD